MQITLLTKKDEWSKIAHKLALSMFPTARIFDGNRNEPFPDEIGWTGKGDVLISFLSPWIVPAEVLRRFETAVNFHPAPREFPGIGCYNFALYFEAKEYGALYHHMAEKVDTGDIIDEHRFPVFDTDTVETLKLRTMSAMLSMFHDALSRLKRDGTFLHNRGVKVWTRKPFTRSELEQLCEVQKDMSDIEVARRIRATTYPSAPGPFIELHGTKFHYPVPQRGPLA